MASLTCTLQEFTYFIDPRIQDNIVIMTKKSKNRLNSICQKCNERKELYAAHKHGSSRKEIIKKVLENYKASDGKYEIMNLEKTVSEIDSAHKPIEEHFLFLCRTCHREYDSWTEFLNKESTSQTLEKSKANTSHSGTHAAKDVKPLSSSKNTDVEEDLCEDESLSWKYKIGWTAIKNRKNILDLIDIIESNFDCYPVAFKSWYFHRRNDNRKQFSAILTNKYDSIICFRVIPNTFPITDSRIIHGKRWFFAEGKEKRVKITPENYELIIWCLNHAYAVSGY